MAWFPFEVPREICGGTKSQISFQKKKLQEEEEVWSHIVWI